MVRFIPTGRVFLGRLIGLGLLVDSVGLLGKAISMPGGQLGKPHSRCPQFLSRSYLVASRHRTRFGSQTWHWSVVSQARKGDDLKMH